MPIWLRKTLVVMITVFTFGLVTPPAHLSIQQPNSNDSSKSNIIESQNEQSDSEFEYFPDSEPSEIPFVKKTIAHAENVAFEKFGSKIGPAIESEFRGAILPKIEEIIADFSNQYEDDELRNLAITEKPSGGIGERIFNIYDKTSGKDLIRFHVRRDKLPLEGYWFNFHYHTHHDSFADHHELGEIYWDKNTPPKWLS